MRQRRGVYSRKRAESHVSAVDDRRRLYRLACKAQHEPPADVTRNGTRDDARTPVMAPASSTTAIGSPMIRPPGSANLCVCFWQGNQPQSEVIGAILPEFSLCSGGGVEKGIIAALPGVRRLYECSASIALLFLSVCLFSSPTLPPLPLLLEYLFPRLSSIGGSMHRYQQR